MHGRTRRVGLNADYVVHSSPPCTIEIERMRAGRELARERISITADGTGAKTFGMFTATADESLGPM